MALADAPDAAVGTFGGRKTALGYQRGAWVSMATSAPSGGAVRAGAAELLALALARRGQFVGGFLTSVKHFINWLVTRRPRGSSIESNRGAQSLMGSPKREGTQLNAAARGHASYNCQEFLQGPFSRPGEALHFLSAELSDASCKVLLRKIERVAGEFRDLADLDRTVPAKEKRSMATLLAVRPWVFSVFDSLRVLPAAADRERR